jgi:hypothetical protein
MNPVLIARDCELIDCVSMFIQYRQSSRRNCQELIQEGKCAAISRDVNCSAKSRTIEPEEFGQ